MRSYLVILAALMLSACNPFNAPEEAEAAVETFRENYNSGAYDQIWDSFGPEFGAVTSREDWDNLIETVREVHGNSVSTEQVNINWRSATDGSFLVITMQTQFERGEGLETFTFKGEDGNRRLIGYNLSSDAVMRHMMDAAVAQRNQAEELTGE